MLLARGRQHTGLHEPMSLDTSRHALCQVLISSDSMHRSSSKVHRCATTTTTTTTTTTITTTTTTTIAGVFPDRVLCLY